MRRALSTGQWSVENILSGAAVRATVGVMRHELSHLDDPAATIRQIHGLCPLQLGHTIVAAVRLTDQVVTGAKVAIGPGEDLPGYPDGPELARRIADEIVPERGSISPDNGGISHTLVTVVCRDGYVIPGRLEFGWLRAWLYSNHLRGAFGGDAYVVTPHGWTGTMDHRAGYEPCFRAAVA